MGGAFVAYLRVSTQRQGQSGLGLEAQREAVRSYLNGRELVGEFVEVETGKGSNALAKRPKLREALEQARKRKATLIVAKLDRLARNNYFVAGLLEAKVNFVACDMPEANRTMLQMMSVFGEYEREMISRRTREALAAAKARGRALGTHGKVQAVINRAKARDDLEPLRERLASLRDGGATLRSMVETLNGEGVRTPAGGSWHVSSLHKALGRLAA